MLQTVVEFIKIIFLQHKMKIVLLLACSLMFFVLFFPLTELGEKIVAETNASGLIYLEFETMDLHFFSATGRGDEAGLGRKPHD